MSGYATLTRPTGLAGYKLTTLKKYDTQIYRFVELDISNSHNI